MPSIDLEVLNAGERFLGGACRSVELYPELALRFDGGALFVGSDWRVSRGGDVIASSVGDEGRVTELIGASVKSLASRGKDHELVVGFDNEAVLETFDVTDQHEHWRIWGPEGELIVGGPGNSWSSFGPAPRTGS